MPIVGSLFSKNALKKKPKKPSIMEQVASAMKGGSTQSGVVIASTLKRPPKNGIGLYSDPSSLPAGGDLGPAIADMATPAYDRMSMANQVKALREGWAYKQPGQVTMLQNDPSTVEGAMAKYDELTKGRRTSGAGGPDPVRDKIKYRLLKVASARPDLGFKTKEGRELFEKTGDLLAAVTRDEQAAKELKTSWFVAPEPDLSTPKRYKSYVNAVWRTPTRIEEARKARERRAREILKELADATGVEVPSDVTGSAKKRPAKKAEEPTGSPILDALEKVGAVTGDLAAGATDWLGRGYAKLSGLDLPPGWWTEDPENESARNTQRGVVDVSTMLLSLAATGGTVAPAWAAKLATKSPKLVPLLKAAGLLGGQTPKSTLLATKFPKATKALATTGLLADLTQATGFAGTYGKRVAKEGLKDATLNTLKDAVQSANAFEAGIPFGERVLRGVNGVLMIAGVSAGVAGIKGIKGKLTKRKITKALVRQAGMDEEDATRLVDDVILALTDGRQENPRSIVPYRGEGSAPEATRAPEPTGGGRGAIVPYEGGPVAQGNVPADIGPTLPALPAHKKPKKKRHGEQPTATDEPAVTPQGEPAPAEPSPVVPIQSSPKPAEKPAPKAKKSAKPTVKAAEPQEVKPVELTPIEQPVAGQKTATKGKPAVEPPAKSQKTATKEQPAETPDTISELGIDHSEPKQPNGMPQSPRDAWFRNRPSWKAVEKYKQKAASRLREAGKHDQAKAIDDLSPLDFLNESVRYTVGKGLSTEDLKGYQSATNSLLIDNADSGYIPGEYLRDPDGKVWRYVKTEKGIRYQSIDDPKKFVTYVSEDMRPVHPPIPVGANIVAAAGGHKFNGRVTARKKDGTYVIDVETSKGTVSVEAPAESLTLRIPEPKPEPKSEPAPTAKQKPTKKSEPAPAQTPKAETKPAEPAPAVSKPSGPKPARHKPKSTETTEPTPTNGETKKASAEQGTTNEAPTTGGTGAANETKSGGGSRLSDRVKNIKSNRQEGDTSHSVQSGQEGPLPSTEDLSKAFPGWKATQEGSTITLQHKSGKKVTIEGLDVIDEGIPLADGQIIAGSARVKMGNGEMSAEGVIALAKGGRPTTVFHEAFHVMEKMGLFKEKEWDTLLRNFGHGKHDDPIENVADAYEAWLAGRHPGNKLFGKIRNFFSDMLKAITRPRQFASERVYRKMESGRVWNRLGNRGPSPLGGRARYSIQDNDTIYLKEDELYECARDAIYGDKMSYEEYNSTLDELGVTNSQAERRRAWIAAGGKVDIDPGRISHAHTGSMTESLGGPPREPHETEHLPDLSRKAVEGGYAARALDIAESILEDGAVKVSRLEQEGLAIKRDELARELSSKFGDPSPEAKEVRLDLLDKIIKINMALDVVGTSAGQTLGRRAFRVRYHPDDVRDLMLRKYAQSGKTPDDDAISDAVRQAEELLKMQEQAEKVYAAEQKAKTERYHNEVGEPAPQPKGRTKPPETPQPQETATSKPSSRRPKAKFEHHIYEAAKLINSGVLDDVLSELALSKQGTDPAEVFRKHVSVAVSAKINDGLDLTDAVNATVQELSAATGKQISERKVRDLFSGYGKPKLHKDPTAAQLAKREARLLSLIEDIENGIEFDTTTRKRATTQRIRALEERLASLKRDAPEAVAARLEKRKAALLKRLEDARAGIVRPKKTRGLDPLANLRKMVREAEAAARGETRRGRSPEEQIERRRARLLKRLEDARAGKVPPRKPKGQDPLEDLRRQVREAEAMARAMDEEARLDKQIETGQYDQYWKTERPRVSKDLQDIRKRIYQKRARIDTLVEFAGRDPETIWSKIDSVGRSFQLASIINRTGDAAGNMAMMIERIATSHIQRMLDRKLFRDVPLSDRIPGVSLRTIRTALKDAPKRIVDDIVDQMKFGTPDFKGKYGIYKESPGLLKYIDRLAGVTDVATEDIVFNVYRDEFLKLGMHPDDAHMKALSIARDTVLMSDSLVASMMTRATRMVKGRHSKDLLRLAINMSGGRFGKVISNLIGYQTDHIWGGGIAKAAGQWGLKVLNTKATDKSLNGLARLRNKIENTEWTFAERDLITKRLIRGGIGAALTAIGYLLQKKGADVEKFVQDHPILGKILQSIPQFSTIMFGAKLAARRKKGEPRAMNDKVQKGVAMYAKELISHPYTEPIETVIGVAGFRKTTGQVLGEITRRHIPPDIRLAAQVMDKGASRNPRTFVETVKTGIPGLRKQVPAKKFTGPKPWEPRKKRRRW